MVTATSIRSGLKRIYGRKITSHDVLVDKITKDYQGVDGAETDKVLEDYTKKYNLLHSKYKNKNKKDVTNALDSKRPVVVRFDLSPE